MMFTAVGRLYAAARPWDNGRLRVSADGRFLMFDNGRPFFWLGDTGWLMPERLNRDEAEYYLSRCEAAGYNVVQVQVINGIPAFNVYGQMSMPAGFDFSAVDRKGVYGYWDHMDYIIDRAAAHGIYVGMVCIWGGMVKAGQMNEAQARSYGMFLANRYKNRKNIVWIMGGDIQGDIRTGVWDALATKLQKIFQSVMKRSEDRIDPIRSRFGAIRKESVSLEQRIGSVMEYARTHRRFRFHEVLKRRTDRLDVVVTFLAVLELMKIGSVYLSQEAPFGDMYIEARDTEGAEEISLEGLEDFDEKK